VLAKTRGSQCKYSTTRATRRCGSGVCEHLAEAVNLRCSPEQILITNGSQQALDLIAKVFDQSGRYRAGGKSGLFGGAAGHLMRMRRTWSACDRTMRESSPPTCGG